MPRRGLDSGLQSLAKCEEVMQKKKATITVFFISNIVRRWFKTVDTQIDAWHLAKCCIVYCPSKTNLGRTCMHRLESVPPQPGSPTKATSQPFSLFANDDFLLSYVSGFD